VLINARRCPDTSGLTHSGFRKKELGIIKNHQFDAFCFKKSALRRTNPPT
jgi:hypothetical protein